jgi:hypothetical protein
MRLTAKCTTSGKTPLAGTATGAKYFRNLGHGCFIWGTLRAVVTTELYLGVKQNLHDAPCDHLGITPMSNDSDRI